MKDPATWRACAEAVGPTLAPFKGEVALRGRVAGVLQGLHGDQMVVISRDPPPASQAGFDRLQHDLELRRT